MRAFRPLALLPIALALVVACDKATPVAPVGATITLTVNPTRIETDGVATVTALVRRETGQPVNPGTEILFATTLGRLAPESVPTDARGLAETTLFGNREIGTATVTARSGAADAGEGAIMVQIGSLAQSVSLEVTPDFLPRTGGRVELIAVLTDDVGQLLDDLAVTFEADAGTLDVVGPVFTNAPCPGAAAGTGRSGVACNFLTVTEADISRLDDFLFEVRALAATTAGGDMGGTVIEEIAEIEISGLVSMIELQATPSTVPEAGGSVDLTAVVLDEAGDPVDDANVIFGTEVGSLASRGSIVPTNSLGEAFDVLSVNEADLSTVGGTTFNVLARATAIDGSEVSDTFMIRVERAAPRADFTFTVADFIVTFTNTSTGEEPLTFEWSFGDGSPNSTLRTPPPHDYMAAGAGMYEVSLTATNAQLGASDVVTKTVTVPQAP